jgi:hypothetical protein
MILVSTIATALKKELWSYFSTEAHRDNDIVRYINSAARAITIARNFDFNQFEYSITVVDWTTSYDIPYQIETFYVLDSNWDEVDIFDFSEYNKEKDKTDKIWIRSEVLKCTTPWTYTVFYRWYIPQITSLNDTLSIPDHFYDLIVLKATYFWYMDIRAFDKWNNKEAIFQGMIKSLATRSSNPKPLNIKRLNKDKNSSNIW